MGVFTPGSWKETGGKPELLGSKWLFIFVNPFFFLS